MASLKDIILTADDLSQRTVDVPEWPHPDTGQPVRLLLKAPSLRRRNQLQASFTTDDTGKLTAEQYNRIAVTLLGEMVFDPDDIEAGPLFADPADRDALLDKSGAVCWRISEECMVLAGFKTVDDSDSPEEALVDAGKGYSW